MTLSSNLFAGDPKLEACAVSNASHIVVGAAGPHVRKVQAAVTVLDGAIIDRGELDAGRYGTSTARAVLAYKTKRKIVNRAYQSQADNIVGIMTIKAMDDELIAGQIVMQPATQRTCERICGCGSHGGKAELIAELTRSAQRTARQGIGDSIRSAKA